MPYRTIAIDCDDVIIGTTPITIQRYNEAYGTSLELSDMYTDNLERWGVQSDDEAIARIEKYLRTVEYRSQPPFKEAIEVIKRLQGQYELHVVTGRSKFLEAATRDMLTTYFPDTFRSVVFTSLFTADKRSKVDVCRELEADLLIEDHLGHALPVAKCGTDVLLFGDYPWNQAAALPANVRRVHDWHEIAQLLLP